MDILMKEAAQANGLEPGRGKHNQSDYGWDGGFMVAQIRPVTQSGSVRSFLEEVHLISPKKGICSEGKAFEACAE